MLKNIPASISPELLKLLSEMGQGDELLIAGANYPVKSMGIERVCGVFAPAEKILEDVLKLIPLSEEVACATMYFEEDEQSDACERYTNIIKRSEESEKMQKIDRLDKYPFSNRAGKVYLAIVSNDVKSGGEIILTKGAVR